MNKNEYVFTLKIDYDKITTQLRQKYERAYNDSKLNTKQDIELTIKLIEDKEDIVIKILTASHAEKYTNIKNYYADIITNNWRLKLMICKKEYSDWKIKV